jgi:hypothetical protein
MRYGDGIQIACLGNVCFDQRLFDHRLNREYVLAAGQFREDAAKAAMQLDLGCDDIAGHVTTVGHDGSRGFITAGFNG